jgi:1-acyl-sn-glycerol-3-phosphate acyltransferase
MDRIPSGQTIVVTHHDGGVLPVNGICFGLSWYDHTSYRRPLYVLSHDVLHDLAAPLFSRFFADSGLIRADRRMMDAALATGHSVMVFPGAARETFRPYTRRREIDLGGRAGFVAQAIRWGIPITPLVSAGAHETVFVLARGHRVAKALGIPKLVRSGDVMPLQLGLPWGIWALPFLPHVPLPAKITSEVLPPIDLSEALGVPLKPSDARDRQIVEAGFRVILARMRAAVDRLYDERVWPVIG